MPAFIDLTGQRFGRLIVIKRMDNQGTHTAWLCKCDCGNEKIILGTSLKKGLSKSCRCLANELAAKRKFTHGKSNTREYKIWCGIIKRCYNQKTKAYKNYGGRGIFMSEEWRASFEIFLSDMGESPSKKHTVERVNNDKGYSKDNCIWLLLKLQPKNKRSNRIITYKGETKILIDWSRKLKVKNSTLQAYLKKHSMEEAVNRYQKTSILA